MKIGELFSRREARLYPSIANITEYETLRARRAYPNAKSDDEALAMMAFTLRKNLNERTAERDRYRASHTR